MNKALPGLPRPLPDELLYSVIARAALHLGHWSPKGLLETIYGRRNILATPDLPSSLSLIADLTQEAWGMTLVELALRHTLVGYYTHFLGEVRQRQVIAAMAGKSAHLHLRLGICAGTVRSITRFRMCPVCAEDDVRQFGHTYWHRSHQLPGVLVCPLHEVVLLTCSTPFRPVGRHEHVAAIPQMLSTSQWQKRPADWPSASHLARECSALLDAPATTEGPLHDYRPLLAPLGFHRKRDGLTRFTEAFFLRWGSDVISQLFTQQDNRNSLRWLEEIARKPRRPLHPLKHLLIRGCISGGWPQVEECAQEIAVTKTWGIYRSNQLRKEASALVSQGLTINAVANALDLDWKTAFRLLAPIPCPPKQGAELRRLANADKAAWLELIARHPEAGRTELRRKSPALYGRLYRREPKWLLRQFCQKAFRCATRPRIDWSKRDSTLANLIRGQIELIKKEIPLVRASRSRVLGKLGRRALVAHYSAKLPISTSVLTQQCESVRTFRVRRLANVMQCERQVGLVPAWLAFRWAGIRPESLPDNGWSLLNAARHANQVAWQIEISKS